MKKLFLHPHQNGLTAIAFILISTLSSLIIMGLVFPDLLIHLKMVFVHQHDTEIPYEGVFALVSHYYQGGIQLWNRFDQSSYGFFHITAGLYTLANLMTTIAYIFISPFFDSPSQAFQSIHSVGFHAAAIFIRTVGGYLLLRRLCANPLIIFISLIYLNTLLSSEHYLGYVVNSYYSMLPLLVYFILRFFESFRLKEFLGAFTTMTLTVASCPLLALGYFYQAIHFFLITCLARAMLTKDKGSLRNLFKAIKEGFIARNLVKICMVVTICLAIMLPYLQMQKTLEDDFFIPAASYEEKEGRLENKFSIKKYFSKPTAEIPVPKEFLWKVFDFWENDITDWVFLGFSTMFFAGTGIILSKNTTKHLFAWTILLIIFLQFPRTPTAITSFAHWINVLSNPFHFLVRGPHMTAQLIPFLLAPLVALGIKAFADLVHLKNSDAIHYQRVPFYAGILILGIFTFIFYIPGQNSLPETIVRCALFSILMLLAYLYFFGEYLRVQVLAFLIKNRTKAITTFIFIFLVADLALLKIYIQRDTWSNVRLFEGNIEGLDDSGLIVPIYQNPKIFPFREFYRGNPKELVSRDPTAKTKYVIRNPQYHNEGRPQDPSSVSWYRVYSREFLYGIFYQFSHMGRYFFPPSIYNPLHSTYKNLHDDTQSQKYLQHDQHIISLADYATDSNNARFSSLILNRKMVYLDKNIGDFEGKFPTNLTNMSVHSSLLLGHATEGNFLDRVWVYISARDDLEPLSLSALDQNGQILAIANESGKDSSDPSIIKFSFTEPLRIESGQKIDLILNAPSDTMVKKDPISGKLIYFENSNPISRQQDFSFPFSVGEQIKNGSYTDYIFDLPESFPKYISSTIFTEDQYNLEVSIQGKVLQPVQGKLVRHFTYDIQNIESGKIILRIPKDYNTVGKKVVLRLRTSPEILSVWKNEHDNLGIDYHAPKEGWLIFHYPYDNRWRLTIDDKPVKLYRANQYFLGTPIKKGVHKILIQYWPDTWLRESILISMCLMMVTFLYLIFLGIRLENSKPQILKGEI